MQQLLGVLLGGLLALLGAMLNSRIQEERQSRREARSLARAFRGEILALREIVQRRKYSEVISTAIETMRRTGQPYELRIPVRRGYFAIFNNNVAKLGMLEGMLPETIATFYVQANSILEDITSINEGLFSGNVPALMQVYAEVDVLLSDSSALALRIADEVLLLYP
jgi:hypothetical protein